MNNIDSTEMSIFLRGSNNDSTVQPMQAWRPNIKGKPNSHKSEIIAQIMIWVTNNCAHPKKEKILSALRVSLSSEISSPKFREALKLIGQALPWLFKNVPAEDFPKLKLDLFRRGWLADVFGKMVEWVAIDPSFQKLFSYHTKIEMLFDDKFIADKMKLINVEDLPLIVDYLQKEPSCRQVFLLYCIVKISINQSDIQLAETMASLIPELKTESDADTISLSSVMHEIRPDREGCALRWGEMSRLLRFVKTIKNLATFDVLIAKGLRHELLAFCKTVLKENGEYFSVKGKLYLKHFFNRLLEQGDLAGALDLAEFCKGEGFIKHQQNISPCVGLLVERHYFEESIALHAGIVEKGRMWPLSMILGGGYSENYQKEYNTNFKDFYVILLRLVESDQWNLAEEVIQWFPDTTQYSFETDKRSKYLKEAVEHLVNNHDLKRAHKIASFIPDNKIRENCMKKIESLLS